MGSFSLRQFVDDPTDWVTKIPDLLVKLLFFRLQAVDLITLNLNLVFQILNLNFLCLNFVFQILNLYFLGFNGFVLLPDGILVGFGLRLQPPQLIGQGCRGGLFFFIQITEPVTGGSQFGQPVMVFLPALNGALLQLDGQFVLPQGTALPFSVIAQIPGFQFGGTGLVFLQERATFS